MSSSWIRVATGFSRVASAATARASGRASVTVEQWAHHGFETAQNATTAVQAASTLLQRQPQTGTFTETTPNSHAKNNAFAGEPPTTQAPPSQELQPPELIPQTNQAHKMIDDERIRAPAEGTIEGMNTHDADTVPISNTAVPNALGMPELAETNHRLKEGQAVPSTRVGRAVGFASLGLGLFAGTAVEAASRLLGSSSSETDKRSSVVASDANATRLALALCRMRGAALKLGQMLSIQDESLLPPALSKALTQVRQGADAMPSYQLNQQLEREWGMDWASKLSNMEETPFAAASIGQVHRATTLDQRSVVVKVQYPGVANSIESDLRNLSMLVKLSGLAPKGLFIDEVIRVGREELKEECNYLQEAKNQLKFKELVESDEVLVQNKFRVPGVAEELTTNQILVTEYAPGGTIDKVAQFGSQEERNRIGRQILRLTIQELFVWRFMQTDPNWGNFLHDMGTGTTYLIDFGAARLFDKKFVDGYLRIVWASANRDGPTLMDQSHKMKFLTGQENDIMLEAHKMSGFTVGEPFATNDPFDFRGSNISTRLSEHSSAFLQHRLTPPPEEVYTLHRKLAGAYMLCIKLGATIQCRDLLEEVVRNHNFEDGMNHPMEEKETIV